jgi:hypothetical protein
VRRRGRSPLARTPGKLPTIGFLGSTSVVRENAAGILEPDGKVAQTPEMWASVRRHAAPDEPHLSPCRRAEERAAVTYIPLFQWSRQNSQCGGLWRHNAEEVQGVGANR